MAPPKTLRIETRRRRRLKPLPLSLRQIWLLLLLLLLRPWLRHVRPRPARLREYVMRFICIQNRVVVPCSLEFIPLRLSLVDSKYPSSEVLDCIPGLSHRRRFLFKRYI